LEPERPLPVRKSGAPEEWSAYDHAFPLALEIELTKICNWRCDFCYNVFKVFDNFEPVTQGRHLPLDAVELVMAEAYESGCLRLRFSGGEPTLHPDFDRIIGSGGSYGFDMELFTNGSRITPARADYLASNRLRVMLVSLHGNAATHNRLADHQRAHEQSLRAMSLAVERGITVIAEALLFADNAGEMLDVAQRVADLGVKDLSLMPYVPFGPADPRRPIPGRQVANLVDTLKLRGPAGMRYRVPCAPRHCLSSEPSPIDTPVAEEFDNHCGAGLLWASVSYDGRFRHCPHSNVYAGHVADGVGKLWRERMRPRIRGIIAEAEAACGGCSQFGACKGGCHLSLVQSYEEVAQ
jgi:radical SAM protein with 4Fe4S-binding SPASM domain